MRTRDEIERSYAAAKKRINLRYAEEIPSGKHYLATVKGVELRIDLSHGEWVVTEVEPNRVGMLGSYHKLVAVGHTLMDVTFQLAIED